MMNKQIFATRGVIEGFYGVFYTAPERDELIRFIGQHGLNTYLYAPKNDRYQRAHWWEPYPEKLFKQLAHSVTVAHSAGVDFCYAISPGLSLSYASAEDYQAVYTKLRTFFEAGARSFSLLLDDIPCELRYPADQLGFASLANAQADFANRLYADLQALDPLCSLSLCPTIYYGPPPFDPYLAELGEALRPEIELFYTGIDICAPQIGVAELRAFAAVTGRKAVIWDNYPVNDLHMRTHLHMGPLTGRDPGLAAETGGILANLMIQPEASKIPLLTFAEYANDPQGYDPRAAWDRALDSVCGSESAAAFKVFAAYNISSCLGDVEPEAPRHWTVEALDELRLGVPVLLSPKLKKLTTYLAELGDALYHLQYEMDNLALRSDLLPWIELMETWKRMALEAIRALVASEEGEDPSHHINLMEEYLQELRTQPKRVSGSPFLPLAEYTLSVLKPVAETIR